MQKKLENYSGPYFILNHDLLKPGDIILERGYARHSAIISKYSNSRYSHAMICAEGTIIEATQKGGVFSRIPNRSTVHDIRDFKVLRLKVSPGHEAIQTICEHARYLCGSQYSVAEALKVKVPVFLREFSDESRKQFCSRLIAQCYKKAGINLVNNINFCSPGDIERSNLLHEVTDMVHCASEIEVAHAQSFSPHESHMKNTVKFVRTALEILESHGVKTVGSSDGEFIITTLNDISQAVYENRANLDLDEELTDAILSSGYLDHIDTDRRKNPYRYNSILFKQAMRRSAEGSEDRLLETLNNEINRDFSVFEVRLKSYCAARENMKIGLRYFEKEFMIPDGLLRGIVERIIVIDDFISEKKDCPGFKEISDICHKVIHSIKYYAPELLGP